MVEKILLAVLGAVIALMIERLYEKFKYDLWILRCIHAGKYVLKGRPISVILDGDKAYKELKKYNILN